VEDRERKFLREVKRSQSRRFEEVKDDDPEGRVTNGRTLGKRRTGSRRIVRVGASEMGGM
jgi:hypothetical protein